MWAKIAWLAAAGALGTLARFALSGLVQKLHETGFPFGTLAVNASGCLLFGLVWCLAEERMVISGEARLLVLVGFMGAFTTFSTYSFETVQLLRDAQWFFALANLALNNLIGFFFVFLGMTLGRLF